MVEEEEKKEEEEEEEEEKVGGKTHCFLQRLNYTCTFYIHTLIYNVPPLEQRTVFPYQWIPIPSLCQEEHHWSRWQRTLPESEVLQRPHSCRGEPPHEAGNACCLPWSERRREEGEPRSVSY